MAAALRAMARARAATGQLRWLSSKSSTFSAVLPPEFVRDADARDLSLRLVDCADGASYVRAHIPGATLMPVAEGLKDPRNPAFVLPARDFEALTQALGVGTQSTVVLYDSNGGLAASRAWWVLKYYGLERVCVLDGGWQAYARSGAPVSVDADERFPPEVPAEQRVTARPQAAWLATLTEVADAARAGATTYGALQVLDSRTPGEYDGTDTRGNRYAGHVPGAALVPFSKVLGPGGRLLPADELRRLFDAAGLRPDTRTVAYCQAGVRASVAALALTHAGFTNVAVYDGSMREYNNVEGLPRTTGSAR